MNKVCAISLILFILFIQSPAQAKTENDLSYWSFTTITLPITDKVRLLSQINPRLNDNLSNFDTLFLRNGIGYYLTDNVSIWAGYDWFTNYNFDEVRHEHRPWQQIWITNNYKNLELQNRTRLEERIFNNSDVVTRLRHMLRLSLPFNKAKTWRYVAQEEFFLNFNSGSSGDSGYAENRIFLGLNRQFNDRLNLDFGYQLTHINRDDDLLNHTLLTNLYINL